MAKIQPDSRGVPVQVVVRAENPGEAEAICNVVSKAFPTAGEAKLVDALRASGNQRISLVAVLGERIVGHVAFSPVTLEGAPGVPAGLGLAPVAVLPEVQNQGIGMALIDRGLEECRQLGACFVVVLGDPSYYRRFGFLPASDWGMTNEYQAHDEFMAIELANAGIPRPAGLARYSSEFSSFA